MWGVMIKAINLIQEARFSYLRVSEKCVIFDLLPFCWPPYQYSYPLSICMPPKDVYEWRIMPLMEGNGIGLALPRSTLLFFDISWRTDSGVVWGWCITPTGIQCMKTHNTTINQHGRVVSITWEWEWCLFLTNKPWFSSLFGWWNRAWLGIGGHPNNWYNNKQQWIVLHPGKEVHRKRTFHSFVDWKSIFNQQSTMLCEKWGTTRDVRQNTPWAIYDKLRQT